MSRNGPALWDALLDAVRPHTNRDVLIAGGCIRDHLLGLEPKDIDIFVACESREELEDVAGRLNRAGMFAVDMIPYGNEDDYEAAFEADLVGVLEGEAMGLPVNVIARTAHQHSEQALIASFDFHILQATYDGTEMTYGDKHWQDFNNRTATLAHQRHPELSYVRFDRFNSRNPGVLTLVDPWQLSFDFI